MAFLTIRYMEKTLDASLNWSVFSQLVWKCSCNVQIQMYMFPLILNYIY